MHTGNANGIETIPTPENIAKCHQQSQSPLFNLLPPEIRNNIFSLALLQYEDLAHPYPENSFCCRPGHRARRVVDTNLLLTCRRVWLEANHWPMEQAVHTFWLETHHRPNWNYQGRLGCNDDDLRFRDFFYSLSDLQQPRIKHIQIFGRMSRLGISFSESFLWTCIRFYVPNLKTFTITIRHTDWKRWGFLHLSELSVDWVYDLLQLHGVTRIAEFRLELEMLEWRTDELRPLLHSLKSIGVPRGSDDAHWQLVEPFETSSWSGPNNLGGSKHGIYSKRDSLDYRITTLKWRPCNVAADKIEHHGLEEKSLLNLSEIASAGSGDDWRGEEASSRRQGGFEGDDSVDDDYDDEKASYEGNVDSETGISGTKHETDDEASDEAYQ